MSPGPSQGGAISFSFQPRPTDLHLYLFLLLLLFFLLGLCTPPCGRNEELPCSEALPPPPAVGLGPPPLPAAPVCGAASAPRQDTRCDSGAKGPVAPAVAVTAPQQAPAAGAPQARAPAPAASRPAQPPQTAVAVAPGGPAVAQEMQDNVKKCKNFLATLIKLASHNSPSPETSKNVKSLVQDLLDAKIDPEEFTSRLQAELKSSPQPYLVPFLKKSLPALRLSLLSSQHSVPTPQQGVKPGVYPGPPVAGGAAVRVHYPNSVGPATGAGGLAAAHTAGVGMKRGGVSGGQVWTPVATPCMRAQAHKYRPNTIPPPSPRSGPLVCSQQDGDEALGAVYGQTHGHIDRKSLLSHTDPERDALYPDTHAPPSPTHESSPCLCKEWTVPQTGRSRRVRDTGSGNQKNKPNDPGGGSFRDDDDINDVASMAGVNLNEESARILATNSELVGTHIRSCKDEAFLHPGLLHRRILEAADRVPSRGRRRGRSEACADFTITLGHTVITVYRCVPIGCRGASGGKDARGAFDSA
ncbi:unnamed protein product [Arctogadus glacialis]